MATIAMNNRKITIDKYEVDMSVRSHPIKDDVIELIKLKVAEKANKKLGAAQFKLHRNNLRVIIANKTCSPETLMNILIVLFPKAKVKKND